MKWTVTGNIPSAKNTLRIGKRGNFYHKNDEVRTYIKWFDLNTPKEFKQNIDKPVHVYLEIYRKDRKKDVQNLEIVIFDAMEKCGVIKNDNLIVSHAVYGAFTDKVNPRVIISLEIL